jgi:hypothetical protein
MSDTKTSETFHFRNLHPQVFIGTASDRYAGWIGQIYSQNQYTGRIIKRTRIIAGRTYVAEVLPVDRLEEYFEPFRFWKSILPSIDPSKKKTANPPGRALVADNRRFYIWPWLIRSRKVIGQE